MKVTCTSTRLAGMVKVYSPSPRGVRARALPVLSAAERVSGT